MTAKETSASRPKWSPDGKSVVFVSNRSEVPDLSYDTNLWIVSADNTDKGYIDESRLGVGGWSYGGILTNYVITKTTRFNAAISGASLGMVRANFGHDQYIKWYKAEFGMPWENQEARWTGTYPL